MLREKLGNLLYTSQDAGLVRILSKCCFHRTTDCLPLAAIYFRVNTAVRNDFHIPVSKEKIDKHAIVVLGIPDAELGEDINCPLAGRHPFEKRSAV